MLHLKNKKKLYYFDIIKIHFDVNFIFSALKHKNNKLALLWGEAQKKIAYSYLKVT